MNSNQRSQGNNQSDNAGNEKTSKRGGSADQSSQSRQSGPGTGVDARRESQPGDQESVDRIGSQSGSQQKGIPGQKQSNDLAGGLPRSPAGKHLAADQNMDEDTGLSNRINRPRPDTDQGNR